MKCLTFSSPKQIQIEQPIGHVCVQTAFISMNQHCLLNSLQLNEVEYTFKHPWNILKLRFLVDIDNYYKIIYKCIAISRLDLILRLTDALKNNKHKNGTNHMRHRSH